MATSVDNLKEWAGKGIAKGAKWMIVVCDMFEYEEFPVYATSVEHFDQLYNTSMHRKSMEQVMEVYDLESDLETQLQEHRAWRLPQLSRYNTTKDKDNTNPLLSWMDKKGE